VILEKINNNLYRWLCCLIFLTFFFIPITALKLDRVILATDSNPMYLEFWPLTAKVWQQVTGLCPTLVLVADSGVTVDETLGDVIRFEPIPGIPTSLQAQLIRLLIPALFPNDGCILSDIDMIPLQKDYFINSVATVPNDCFVVYRNLANGPADDHYPMCYNAAKGQVFADLFGVTGVTQAKINSSIQDINLQNASNIISSNIRAKIVQWASLGHGWRTDEIVLTKAIKNWSKYHTNVIKLNHDTGPRIDRSNWKYDLTRLNSNAHYIDAHMLRPYAQYKKELDGLVTQLNLLPHYFCTSADSKFFDKTVNLINSINKFDDRLVAKILVFDLGFTPEQRQRLDTMAHVCLRDPELVHADLLKPFKTDRNRYVRGWFAWKPVVIKQALDECPYIFYIDAAIEIYKPLDDLFKHIVEQGYFLISTETTVLRERMTNSVKEQLLPKLSPKLQHELLNSDMISLSAGIQGLSRQVYDSYVLPAYDLAKNLDLFMDDGSAKLGFGAGRHDQIIYTILAYQNNFNIYHNGWMDLKVAGITVPLHAHWNRKELIAQSAFKY
jgi:hypothetical protein